MIKTLLSNLFNRPKPKAKKNGKWKEYNKHAILISEGNYIDGLKDGLWRFYYDSGELMIEEYYDLGKKHGPYTMYHRNGVIGSQGQFKNDLREGFFQCFDESGKMIKALAFKEDRLIEEISRQRIEMIHCV